MKLLNTEDDHKSVERRRNLLAHFDRSPVEQARVNMDNAANMLTMVHQSSDINDLQAQLSQAFHTLGTDAIGTARKLRALVTKANEIPHGESNYIPHPMIVFRAELRNAAMYLGELC